MRRRAFRGVEGLTVHLFLGLSNPLSTDKTCFRWRKPVPVKCGATLVFASGRAMLHRIKRGKGEHFAWKELMSSSKKGDVPVPTGIRIHDLAKQLGVPSKDVLEKAQLLFTKDKVRSHASILNP